jgi:hypothetical protein
MDALRKASRSSLMLHQSIAQSMDLNASDAEGVDYLKEMGPTAAGALSGSGLSARNHAHLLKPSRPHRRDKIRSG